MSGDQLDLDAIEADLNNPWLPVGTVEPHVPALVAEVRRLRALVPDMEPGRWWRVLDEDGGLWMETSRESEARSSMREDAGAVTLERLWVYPQGVGEWRTVQ